MNALRELADALASGMNHEQCKRSLIELATAAELQLQEACGFAWVAGQEIEALRAENQRLTAELRGPGGFIEYQELTGEILRSALEGLPEANADLPHPRPSNRAAVAIARLTAERDEARSPTEGIGKLVRELHEAKAAAESALPALRERCAEIADKEREAWKRFTIASASARAKVCERIAAAIRAIPIEVKT